jgi:hypothetical protein
MLFSSFGPPMKRIRRGHTLPEIPPPHVVPAAGEPRHRAREGGCRRSRGPEQSARGRTSHSRARSPECSASRARRGGPSAGLAAPIARERNFSSLQTIENKRNRVGSPSNPPTFGGSDATAATVSPNQKEARRCVHPRRRWRESAGRRMWGAKFSYPQTLEKAQNGEGIWLAAGLSRRSEEGRISLQRFHSSGSARTVWTRNRLAPLTTI